MPKDNPTFEEVDKIIQKADLTIYQKGGKQHVSAAAAASSPAAAIANVCGIYGTVRPILVLVSSLPLIPKKWKDAIKVFIKVMDTICPQK